MRGIKRLSIIFTAVIVLVIVTTAFANSTKPEVQKAEQPVVISKKESAAPKYRVIRVKNWKPWAHPSPFQVKQIANWEQKKWGGPSLLRRINCESTFNWAADNGTYEGVLQFGPVWNSMWPGTPRKVRMVEIRHPRLKVVEITVFSDGSTKRKVVRRFRATRKVVKTGKLPEYKNLKYPGGPKHAWAAIRVGQRAVSGDGPSTSWECGL